MAAAARGSPHGRLVPAPSTLPASPLPSPPSPPSLRPRFPPSPPRLHPRPAPHRVRTSCARRLGVSRPPGQPPRAPARWSCCSRTPPHRAPLSVPPACAGAPSVRATSRASGWELRASWGPRSARPPSRRSPPSPRPCTTSLGSAGRASRGGRVWGERSALGCWSRASWGTPHGIRIREASKEASQVEPALGTRDRGGEARTVLLTLSR